MSTQPAGGARAAPVIAAFVRGLGPTWRLRRQGEEELEQALAEGPVIYCFWHGQQLPLAWLHRDTGVVGMASESRDGELLARVIGHLGYGVVRGSSSRGGVRALREAARELEQGRSVALAVDGPRGPRHEPHEGAAALAALSGRPLVLAACSCTLALRLGSWDRFEIPLPLARLRVAYRVQPPGKRSRQAVADATQRMRQELLAMGETLRSSRLP